MGRKVVVVGAGIIGLTSAWTLLENGYDVSVVGKNIPGDIDLHYTSPFAGANWASFALEGEYFLQNLDKPGYKKFIEFAKTQPNAGVHIVPIKIIVLQSQLNSKGEIEYPWYRDFVHNFRILEKNELPIQDDVVGGYTFDSVTVTTTTYLHYVLQNIFNLGGTLRRKNLKHINEAYDLHHSGEKADLVVNSTGLLARFLGGVEDKAVHPIRGQIVRVRNNFSSQFSIHLPGFQGETFYAFPRVEGGGILGGTFLPGNWSGIVDEKLKERIIERAKKYIPEIVDPKAGNPPELDVIETYVGLRPGRLGGPRIEREGSIIHNYGIAGAGYQASFGLANEVLRLAEEYFRQSKL